MGESSAEEEAPSRWQAGYCEGSQRQHAGPAQAQPRRLRASRTCGWRVQPVAVLDGAAAGQHRALDGLGCVSVRCTSASEGGMGGLR